MIVGTLRLLPAPHRRERVLEVFRSIQGRVLAQPGCGGCTIWEEHDGEQAIVFVERWESQAALEAHLKSETYLRVLNAIELSGRAPEIRFEQVSSTQGMELIERMRNPAGTTVTNGTGSSES